MENLLGLWQDSGIYSMMPGQFAMIVVCLGLLFLAIRKGFEPLLLVPIGFGGILANIPAIFNLIVFSICCGSSYLWRQ